jgi:hypothetical protein
MPQIAQNIKIEPKRDHVTVFMIESIEGIRETTKKGI